jgi:hypothetical protein
MFVPSHIPRPNELVPSPIIALAVEYVIFNCPVNVPPVKGRA